MRLRIANGPIFKHLIFRQLVLLHFDEYSLLTDFAGIKGTFANFHSLFPARKHLRSKKEISPMILTDAQIQAHLQTQKTVINPNSGRTIQKEGHKQINVALKGQNGENYTLAARQNDVDPENYSAILTWESTESKSVILRRHNGSSHTHKNKIEGDILEEVTHIHMATERYQIQHNKIDGYAEITDRYSALTGAIETLAADCQITNLPSRIFNE